AVELAAFLEQRRLRRVQVLRLSVSQHAPAEPDGRAARAEDRKHDAVAEAVVALALVLDDQAGFHQGLVLIVGEWRFQRLPVIGRVADAEARRDLAAQTTALEVLDG